MGADTVNQKYQAYRIIEVFTVAPCFRACRHDLGGAVFYLKGADK